MKCKHITGLTNENRHTTTACAHKVHMKGLVRRLASEGKSFYDRSSEDTENKPAVGQAGLMGCMALDRLMYAHMPPSSPLSLRAE